jgi:hypothetical protein
MLEEAAKDEGVPPFDMAAADDGVAAAEVAIATMFMGLLNPAPLSGRFRGDMAQSVFSSCHHQVSEWW